MDPELKDKVVLITGGSSGIGQAAAVEFVKHGALVAISGRNEANLQKTVALCFPDAKPEDKDKVLVIVADLANEEDGKLVVTKTIEKFGRLDVLVNCAGILIGGGIENLKLEDYDKQMNINCRSSFVTTQTAAPHLKKSKGSIVNVSSVTGIRAFPGILSYCTSKASMDQMTCCVALDLASYGVRCNSVNPGVIVTEVHKRAGMDDAAYSQFLERSKETHALGRVGQPEEVAYSIVFLASSKLSGFITGVTLRVDGGRGIMCPR